MNIDLRFGSVKVKLPAGFVIPERELAQLTAENSAGERVPINGELSTAEDGRSEYLFQGVLPTSRTARFTVFSQDALYQEVKVFECELSLDVQAGEVFELEL